MARIPEQQVTRLKTEVSIVRLVEAAGIELKKHGGSVRILANVNTDSGAT